MYPAALSHDGVQQRFLVVEGGQHQAGEAGHAGAQLAADGHAVAVGQPYVQHRHVRAQRRDPGQGLRRGGRLADHRQVRLGVQQVVDSAPDDLVVVEHEDPYGLLPPLGGTVRHVRTLHHTRPAG
ncbi:hypothetical protein GCM10020000_76030 [Streptomyces olivoverticillatus]